MGGDQPTAGLVRDRRRAAGLTQRQLAAAAGLSVGAVRDLEQGRTASLRPDSARRLSAALGLDQVRAVRLYALGPLTAWRDSAPVPPGTAGQRVVLGLLALHPNTSVHRDALIDALWPVRPVATAANGVQAHVGALRRTLDPGRPPQDPDGLLVSSGTSYRLQVSTGQLDLLAFGERAGQARALRESDPDAACELYERALRLWRGTPVADVDLLRGHRSVTELGRRHAAVVAEFADAALAAGRHDRALPHLRALAGAEPLDEAAHTRLMLALAGTGQQAAALEVYEQLRHRLDDQLGVGPGPQLAEAHLRVLRQEVPLAAAPLTGILGPRTDRVPRQLPGAVPHVAGRTAELAALTAAWSAHGPGDGAAVTVVTGTAGVGKTVLAVHWARQAAAAFPDGQLYVDLHGFSPGAGPVSADDALATLLEALGTAPELIPAAPDARAARYRSLLVGRRVLVVLDNARDEQQVRPLLPGEPGGLTLVTSRRDLVGLAAAEGARLIRLDVLSAAAAGQLLAARLGLDRAAAEPAALAELADRCARLPLALGIAAARAAARPARPLAAAAAELADSGRRLDALEAGTASLRAAFSWSLADLSPAAARLFCLFGPHQDLTRRDAARLAGLTSTAADRLLAELAAAHLVAESALGRFGCHDLLRAYAAAEQARGADGHPGATSRPR